MHDDEEREPAAGGSAYDVLLQLRPLYQASEQAVAGALRGTGLTVPLRAVLELLLRRGPMTVPEVARDFGVTRQSVQVLVDAGADLGVLAFEDNPRHRRSRHVVATRHGEQTFADVHRRELDNLTRVAGDLDPDDLARCARVLSVLTDRIRQIPDPEQERARTRHRTSSSPPSPSIRWTAGSSTCTCRSTGTGRPWWCWCTACSPSPRR